MAVSGHTLVNGDTYLHVFLLAQTMYFLNTKVLCFRKNVVRAYAGKKASAFTRVRPCTVIHLNGRLYVPAAALQVLESTGTFALDIPNAYKHPYA